MGSQFHNLEWSCVYDFSWYPPTDGVGNSWKIKIYIIVWFQITVAVEDTYFFGVFFLNCLMFLKDIYYFRNSKKRGKLLAN